MDQLSRGTKVIYSLGKGAESIYCRLFEFFLFFYFAQVQGLSGTLAGLAVAVALVSDAITDPLAGSLSDRFRSKWGRRHPFMYLSILPLGISLNLLFMPPRHLGQIALFLWLSLFALLVRLCLSFFFVPYLALGAELSNNYYERSSVVAYRGVAGIVGSAITMVLGLWVFLPSTAKYPKGQMNPDGYPPLALTCSIVVMGLAFITAYGTRGHIPRIPKAPPNPPPYRLTQVFKEMYSAFKNRSFRALFVTLIMLAIFAGINAALLMHFFTFYWGFNSKQIMYFTWAIALGFLLCVPFLRSFHLWFDKKKTFIIGLVVGPLLGSVPVILRETDLFFRNGDPRLLPLLLALYGMLAFLVAMSALTAPSMIADIVDEHEVTTGLRQEGIFFGTSSFSGKAASGFGNLIAGITIDAIGLPKGADVDIAAVAPQVISNLGWVNGPGIVAFSILGIISILQYDMNHERHHQIAAQLRSRGGAELEKPETSAILTLVE
jgi:glycoside/pentoside/hexuronide:cation symporter, GPH family